jgi:hypothetical protein
MALTGQLSQVAEVTTQKITDVIAFSDSIFERLPLQSYAMALFVLWCGLFVGVIHSQRRLALLKKQLDELSGNVRQLELAENRLLWELINSGSRMHTIKTPSPSLEERTD